MWIPWGLTAVKMRGPQQVWFNRMNHHGTKQGELDSLYNSSNFAGMFTRRLGWVFVGPCHPSVHGPPALLFSWKDREFTLRNRAWHTHTHLYDRCKHLSDCRQLNQSCKATEKRWVCNKYVLEHSWKTCTPKQPDLLVGNWAIYEKRAGTPSWSDSVSHVASLSAVPQSRRAPLLFDTEFDTHTHGLHGVFTLQATVPLENKALKGRVEKGEPGCFKKAKQQNHPEKWKKEKQGKSRKGYRPQAWGEMAQ